MGACGSCLEGVKAHCGLGKRSGRSGTFAGSNLPDPDELGDEKEQNDLLEWLGRLKHQETHHELVRFYTAQEVLEIGAFGDAFLAGVNEELGPRRISSGAKSSRTAWGTPHGGGGKTNCWADVVPTEFVVRGQNYLTDHKKVENSFIMGDLVVVDLFEVSHDVPFASASTEIGTIQKVRAAGISGQLLVLNFRICPLQLVVVWEIPTGGCHPAENLLRRFIEDMSDEERTQRLKVIPQIADGPWVVQKVVGNTPAILGKNVNLTYFSQPGLLEVSIEVSSSRLGRRIVGVLQHAATAVVVDVGFVVEGQADEELPEQLLGGFRINRPDVDTLRIVELSPCSNAA
mmetsp:Transcript_51580/g.95450  ORF Transcript_51580/g.95450 Transcript_51580/m.95450 type:complete len:344 (-) Transcript_51580:15-1046(-)